MTTSSSEIQKIKTKISEIAVLIDANGWAERNAGNFSIMLECEPATTFLHSEKIACPKVLKNLNDKYLLVSVTGARMRHIASNPEAYFLIIKIIDDGENYVVINYNDSIQDKQPSSELATHLMIHSSNISQNKDYRFVLHAHVNEFIFLTHNKAFHSSKAITSLIHNMHPEATMFIPDGVGFVPYTLPGSEMIAHRTVKALSNHQIVIWEKHGAFSIADNMDDCFDQLQIASKCINIWKDCKQAGFEPDGLTNDQLKEIRDLLS